MNRFPPTDWSVVLSLQQEDRELARLALETLCRLYWYPLYAFARRRGYSKEDAADVTQDFFVHLLERNTMAKAEQEKGLFRSFLLASFRYFLSNSETRASARMRAPATRVISLDSDKAEAIYLSASSDVTTPEGEYERAWAAAVVRRAWRRLAYKHSTPERAGRFMKLRGFVLAGTPRHAYDAIAEELGISIGALKVATYRLRRDFVNLLRLELAPIASSERDVERELAFVLGEMTKSPGYFNPAGGEAPPRDRL
jgi:DNA-directed RNA polymerase specialized sigma24 family protein